MHLSSSQPFPKHLGLYAPRLRVVFGRRPDESGGRRVITQSLCPRSLFARSNPCEMPVKDKEEIKEMSTPCQWDVNVMPMGCHWDVNETAARCAFGISLASHACSIRRNAMPMTCQEANFRLTQLRSHCHPSGIPLLSTPLLPAVQHRQAGTVMGQDPKKSRVSSPISPSCG